MIQKITTGIDFLDSDLGGFYAHRIYAFCGDYTTAKQTLSAAYLHRGLELGEVCLWLTPRKPEDLFIQLSHADFNFTPYLHNGTLACLEFAAPDGGFANYFKQYLDELGAFIRQRGVERIVFESAQLLFANADERKLPECVRSFVALCDSLNVSTLLLLDKPADPRTHRIEQQVATQITGVFSVDQQAARNRPFVRLEMKKLTGSGDSPYSRDFEIRGGHDFHLMNEKGINWARY
ncbi:MAG: RAD55 family ATPase [Elusimicrobiaceae bacterium]|jgi:KaiC/GvpD/RAD55 family RecA-like ATPase